ncbi:MAG: hypothetical protein COA86_18695 [Kangiella sp.]|nr:MAG: hypothetical protein COA86_18695 [Kangiella sp.]
MKVLVQIILLLTLVCCKSTEEDMNYGLSHYKMGLYNHAIPSLLSATPELEKTDPYDSRVTQAYLALGTMAQADKIYDKSEQFYLKALSSAETLKANKALHLRNIKNTLGNFYISRKSFEKALPLLKSAVALSQDMNSDSIFKAIDLDNLALVYTELGKLKESIELSVQALDLIENSKEHKLYDRTKGIVLYNHGKNIEKFDLFEKALDSYEQSIKSLKIHATNKSHENWRVELVEKAKSDLIANHNAKNKI